MLLVTLWHYLSCPLDSTQHQITNNLIMSTGKFCQSFNINFTKDLSGQSMFGVDAQLTFFQVFMQGKQLQRHGKLLYFLSTVEFSRWYSISALFNLAINPLAYLSTSEDCGYSAQLHTANSIQLPPVEVPIYVLWSDSFEGAPTGWYRAKVTSYHCDGSCDLAYDNGW